MTEEVVVETPQARGKVSIPRKPPSVPKQQKVKIGKRLVKTPQAGGYVVN